MADEIPSIPREVYRAARDASDESQEVDDRIACATEAVWVRAWRAAFEQSATLRHDLDALIPVAQMYLAALDADPGHEMLTLPQALGVTWVREAVERWEAARG